MLRHQGAVLGPVASAPTAWRALDELTPAAIRRIETARARVRRHVWSQLQTAGGVPASRVADTDLGDVVVLDVDATLVTAHSEKEAAAATFKGGYGLSWLNRLVRDFPGLDRVEDGLLVGGVEGLLRSVDRDGR